MIDKARIEGINVPLKADEDEVVESTQQKEKDKEMADVDDHVSVKSQDQNNQMADVVKTEVKEDPTKSSIKNEKGRISGGLGSDKEASNKKKEIEVD